MRVVTPTKRKLGAGPRGGDSTLLTTGFVKTALMFYAEELELLHHKAASECRSASHVLRAAVRSHLGLPPQAEVAGRGRAFTFPPSERPITRTVYLLREELQALKQRALDEQRTASDVAREAVRSYCGSPEGGT